MSVSLIWPITSSLLLFGEAETAGTGGGAGWAKTASTALSSAGNIRDFMEYCPSWRAILDHSVKSGRLAPRIERWLHVLSGASDNADHL